MLARSACSALLGLCPKVKNEWNKCKYHFHEMKGDVGMLMKKKGNKKMPTKVIHNPIPTSLFLSNLSPFYVGIWIPVCIVLFCIVFSLHIKKQQQNKDVGMGL